MTSPLGPYPIGEGFPDTVATVFQAADFIVDSAGGFFYSGPPAPGNLAASITTGPGTDQFGNAYLQGFTAYQPLGGIYVANGLSTTNQLAWYTAPGFGGPYTLVGSVAADVLGDLVVTTTDRFGAASPLIAVLAGGAFESWHTLGGLGVTGYTINFGRFRYEAIGPGYAVYDIELQAGAGGGTAGVYTWTIVPGATYQFGGPTSRSYALGFNGTVAAGANAGSVLIDGAASANPGRVRVVIPGLPAGTVIGGTIWVPLS